MQRMTLLLAVGLAVAGCELTPRATTAEGTVGVGTLRTGARAAPSWG